MSEALELLWRNISQVTSMMNFPTDILDILIVTLLIYEILHLSKSKSAGQIIKAIIVLLVLSYVSGALNLNALNYIVSKVIEVGLVALVVVFQPELRRAMERLGGSSLTGLLNPKSQNRDSIQTIEHVVASCQVMSRQKVGALLVFERDNSLEDYFSTGTRLDAAVSEELIKNLFFPKAALHDGAVIVRQDRLAAAGCVLPLTENPHLSRDLGTRHRAAIGITEHSDAVVAVVSEETGVISCAIGGDLRRYLTPEQLTAILKEELVREERLTLWQRAGKWFRARRKEDNPHEKE